MSTVAQPLPTQPSANPTSPSASIADRLFRAICAGAGFVVVGLAAGILVILVWQSWDTLKHFWEYRLLTSEDWNPDLEPPVYGALAFIFGTLASSAIAMLIAVPMGVGSAAFLAEIAPGPVRRAGSFLVELLAAVPSVVYGFWGIMFLRPIVQFFFNHLGGPNTAGAGILAAGLLLAIMIVPYITAISYDACRSVPRAQREAALSLGATRWQMIWGAVLPYARPAIIAAGFLALGRALGETMAVTMVIGNRPEINFSLFAVGDSMASVIANQLNEADSSQTRSALVAMGLLLFVLTALLNIAARFLIRRMGRKRKSTPAVAKVPLISVSTNGDANTVPSIESIRAPIAKAEAAPSRARWNSAVNWTMTGALGSCLVISIIPLFLILGFIIWNGASSLSWDFFTKTPQPLSTGSVGGLKNALVGSGILVALTLVMAVPVGVLAAVFLAESRAWRLTALVRFITEVLGGVPSIVLGIFAYSLFVAPPVSGGKLNIFGTEVRFGFSAWAGSFALAVMMIPVVVRSAEEALRMVPASLREASFALGANFWQTVVKVLIPAALAPIITGVILATSRIAGETAPLLLTAYGSNSMPRGLGQPTPFLPGYIYQYSTMADPLYQKQAWAAALVLLVTVMALNVVIRLLTGKRVVAGN